MTYVDGTSPSFQNVDNLIRISKDVRLAIGRSKTHVRCHDGRTLGKLDNIDDILDDLADFSYQFRHDSIAAHFFQVSLQSPACFLVDSARYTLDPATTSEPTVYLSDSCFQYSARML